MHPGVSDPESFVLNRVALESLNGSSCLFWSRVFDKSISKWVVSCRISNNLGREYLLKMTKHFKWEKRLGLQWGSKHRTFRSQNLSWPLKWSRGQFSLEVANPQFKLLFGLIEIKPVVPLQIETAGGNHIVRWLAQEWREGCTHFYWNRLRTTHIQPFEYWTSLLYNLTHCTVIQILTVAVQLTRVVQCRNYCYTIIQCK